VDLKEGVWYLDDALGSVYVLTDNNGNVVEAYHYSIYGEPKVYAPDGTSRDLTNYDNCLLFTSREYIWQLHLYYYRFRWYCPSLGRFTAQDPARLGRTFIYVQSKPTVLRDPKGLQESGGRTKLKMRAIAVEFDVWANDIIGDREFVLLPSCEGAHMNVDTGPQSGPGPGESTHVWGDAFRWVPAGVFGFLKSFRDSEGRSVLALHEVWVGSDDYETLYGLVQAGVAWGAVEVLTHLLGAAEAGWVGGAIGALAALGTIAYRQNWSGSMLTMGLYIVLRCEKRCVSPLVPRPGGGIQVHFPVVVDFLIWGTRNDDEIGFCASLSAVYIYSGRGIGGFFRNAGYHVRGKPAVDRTSARGWSPSVQEVRYW